ncbi:hypothetical protein FQA39_LY12660 [Lamprigera yunnana]|nr:hypothetical protein FQA39_LY12660 [Lamprigera yunnana]
MEMAEDLADNFLKRGCEHYKRSCCIMAACCGNLHPCHICHDEAEKHLINRYTIQQHMCLNCKEIQPVDVNCRKCGIRFANYACVLCYIFDDEWKNQFHCYHCGICRVGGADNYFHCKTCNMCLAVRFIGNHKCRENIASGNCPFCVENLYHTRDELHLPPCMHMIHKKCDEELKRNGRFTKCLVCFK